MWQTTKKGFTLIELMVVVSVIVILVAILYPSVASAILSARAAQVQTRISELGNGCILFHNDTNYYPGQSPADLLELANGTTGSQLLAEKMFLDFNDTDWYGSMTGSNDLTSTAASTYNRSTWHWKSRYAPLNWGVVSTAGTGTTTPRCDLMTSAPSDTAVASKPYCIADQFATNFLPILYFPARLAVTDLSQFQESDNSIYYNFSGSQVFACGSAPFNYGWMTPTSVSTKDFPTFTTDTRYGSITTPYHAGEFLLIGAGRDRVYGSPYTLKNWSN